IRAIALVALLLVLLGAAVWAAPHVNLAAVKNWWQRPAAEAPTARTEGGAELAEEPDTLRLPPDVVKAFGVRTAVAKTATQPRPLAPLDGWLAVDSNHLVRVHSRFPGEVMEIAKVANGDAEPGPTQFRPVRLGDRVAKGDLLAVVWSKDLGEKKS